MYYPVDFFLTDTAPAATPLEGVVLRVYSADGKQFYTETLTDAQGHGGFLLDDSVPYQLRLYKYQVSFTNPVLFSVVNPIPPATNVFDLKGTPFVPPVAVDPRLCRASGFFRTATGAPAPNTDIHFIAKFNPLLLEGSAVLTERAINRTDERGFMQIDLIRCGQYDVTIQGMEDLFRSINVPDAPSVNLPDLLFPVISQITFNPPGPWTVTVGTDLVIFPTVIASDGEVIPGTGPGAVVWGTDDPLVCAVLDNGQSLSLRAFKSGTTNLTAVRFDKTIVRYPDLPIVGQPVVITVP
jgi:hypothetical protein